MKAIHTILLYIVAINFCFAQPANTNVSNGVMFDGEPYMAINPTNNQNIVVAWMGLKYTAGEFKILIKTRASLDGGLTWSTYTTLPHMGTGYGSADVSMAFDKNGLLYLSYIDYKQAPDSGGIYVARSYNGGLNWDTPSKAFGMYDVTAKRPIDRPWLVVDNSSSTNSGTLYITTKPAPWINPPNRNYFKTSQDSGKTWSAIANVDGGSHLVGSIIAAPMAAPATTINGEFCAIYPSYVATQNPLPAFYMAKSNNKGQSFNYTTVLTMIANTVDTNFKAGYHVACNPMDSNQMVLLMLKSTNNDVDINAIHSNDGGATWSSLVRVNDNTAGLGVVNDMVWCNYNEQGKLIVTWRDRRNAASTGFWNAGYDFYYAISSDNGQTFATNQQLSSQFIAFDSVIAQNGNDFMCCEYKGDTLYSAWGDTRNGKMNIYFVKTIASTNSNLNVSNLENEEPQFTLFPNPANETIYINVPEAFVGKEAIVYDVFGKKIFSTLIKENVFKLNIKSYAKGIYFLRIGIETKRFVKE